MRRLLGLFRRRPAPRLVCMRLADMHLVHPQQITRQCKECGHEVGIYPSGQAILKRSRRVVIICQACAPHLPAPDRVGLAPGAVAERAESVRWDSGGRA